jgi:hypothetical protein
MFPSTELYRCCTHGSWTLINMDMHGPEIAMSYADLWPEAHVELLLHLNQLDTHCKDNQRFSELSVI